MSEENKRVDFNAPEGLVEKTDVIAEVLDTTRTRILTDALRDEIDDLTDDESLRRRVKEGYYDGELGFEEVRAVLGTEEAVRTRFLRESLDREPPEPVGDGLPTKGDFYDGEVPEWEPDEGSEGGEEGSVGD